MILIQMKPRSGDRFVRARQMLLDRADTDADVRGDLPLRFALYPEASEYRPGSLRQSVQHVLQDRDLLVGDQRRLGRRSLVEFPILAGMRIDPVALAPHASSRRATMIEKMTVGGPVQIGARLRDRTDLCCRKCKIHFLENILRLVRGGATGREKS